jgi:hypothetical protein
VLYYERWYQADPDTDPPPTEEDEMGINTIEREPTAEELKNIVFEEGGSLVVDLTGIEEMKFEALPKGVYEFEVDSVEYKLSKNNGAPMFEFKMRVANGEYENRKVNYYTSFSPKALSGSSITKTIRAHLGTRSPISCRRVPTLELRVEADSSVDITRAVLERASLQELLGRNWVTLSQLTRSQSVTYRTGLAWMAICPKQYRSNSKLVSNNG